MAVVMETERAFCEVRTELSSVVPMHFKLLDLSSERAPYINKSVTV
jgi:hypothetical protein